MALFVQPVMAVDYLSRLSRARLFSPRRPPTTKPPVGTAHSISVQPKVLIASIPLTHLPTTAPILKLTCKLFPIIIATYPRGNWTIEYDVYPQDPTASYVLDTPLIEYGNGTHETRNK